MGESRDWSLKPARLRLHVPPSCWKILGLGFIGWSSMEQKKQVPPAVTVQRWGRIIWGKRGGESSTRRAGEVSSSSFANPPHGFTMWKVS
ncbi:hypothetical protein OJAV_G00125400 [Oryzias javanicus]|uniref:Uncharacterized protein n=1 Tax=Oryzias javanicus TaxID=123683 RepID=A0A3S2LZ36_ORYJA|nr:hypothetical protein OJAV_G00125400 [Oryzias javanicus]